MHLHRPSAHRYSQHLVAEADAEGRDALGDDVADDGHGIFAGGGGVARPVGEKHAVGLERDDVRGRGLGRHHRHLAALAGELAQDVALDAVVDGDHVEFRAFLAPIARFPFPRRLVPGEALARRHHGHEVHAFEARPRARFVLEGVEVELARRLVRDHRVRHALDADAAGERAGIDAGETDDAPRFQPLIEVARGAVVRGRGDRGMQHDAARARRRCHVHGLDIVLVGADIADMGEREGDDLPGIGGIGEDFLIPRHGSVEAHLAHRVAGRAEA